MTIRKFCFFLSAVMSLHLLNAQDTRQTGELWQGITLEYELGDKWDFEFEEQFRLDQNMSSLKFYFLEPALQYKAADWIDFKLKYRYNFVDEGRNFRRYTFDTNLQYDIPNNPIDILYRLRFQDEKVAYTGEKTNMIRNEMGIDANLSKLVDPFAAYEHFYLVRLEDSETRTHRITIGLEWSIEKDLSLTTYYRRDQQVNVDSPDIQNILGIMIKYEIN